ncbi:GTP-binding protein [Hydrogenophaga sp.]|uniref:GTP-binding protein n=1 Tax=Hydrogenophaga sp. TaxID=1904254 RepID=UPI003D0A5920
MVNDRMNECALDPTELKIVFAGSMGAGKTTAIKAISETETVSTDVRNNDMGSFPKLTTTVGLDYGECQLGDNLTLRLYGTPGQDRFRFMWDILGKEAFGVVILVDNSRPDPLADLDTYLEAFLKLVAPHQIVVGVGRVESHPVPTVKGYCDHLAQRETLIPVLSVDVRQQASVKMLLTVLVHNLEAHDV